MEYTYMDVLAKLPHRAPMLMVDGIMSITETTCRAYKNISFAEPCFQGHFPGQPMFPGVLIIEAMAQTASICMLEREKDAIPVFAGVNNTRFKKPVYPGVRMEMRAKLVNQNGRFYTFETRALVDGVEVSFAEVTICV